MTQIVVVREPLDLRDARDVFAAVVSRLCAAAREVGIEVPVEDVLPALQSREEEMATAAAGIATPHAVVPYDGPPLLVIGELSPPLEWPFGSLDDRAVRLVCMTVGPGDRDVLALTTFVVRHSGTWVRQGSGIVEVQAQIADGVSGREGWVLKGA